MTFHLTEAATFYDVLDLKPDASAQEIREAYLRTKAAYNRDSVALYSLISSDERDEMIKRIEEAYTILSNPEKRKEYDSCHGLLKMEHPEDDFFAAAIADTQSREPRNVISIDRVPPMEVSVNAEELLKPPSTDFEAPIATKPLDPETKQAAPFTVSPTREPEMIHPVVRDVSTVAEPMIEDPVASRQAYTTPNPRPPVQALPPSRPPAHAPIPYNPPLQAAPAQTLISPSQQAEHALSLEIAEQTEWRGAFLKKVREIRRISLEEMSATTKITKAYLLAIEEENFAKLPAAVFVRGFVTQVCKTLKLPHERAAAAFMGRYFQARSDQRK